MAKIGVYGGSFNPPHPGHIRAAVQCKNALGLDRVILIPAAEPPHKALADGSPDAWERFRLTELAVQGLDGFSVSDLELRREGKSYTVDTLERLKEEYPSDTLYLMMGTDMFLSFERWYRPERIVRLAQLVCFSRLQPDEALRERCEAQCRLLRTAFACEPILLENEVTQLSSTQIRRLLFFGAADDVLSPPVLRRIQEKQLYGVGKSRRALAPEELKQTVFSLLKPSRTAHVEGVCELASELAERYGADRTMAVRAALLHDVTKALPTEHQMLLCRRFSLDAAQTEASQPALLHAMTAAAAAREIFGECEEVCSAIRWHTTGRANMTTLEKIVYIADMAEKTRSFPGVEEIRQALKAGLDEGVRMGLEMTISHLQSCELPLAGASLEALQSMQKQDT